MISKIKKPISILLVFMMIVSLFAAVPMTVNAAPPGGDGPGGIETEIGTGAVVVPESDYLTFTAEEDNSSVTMNYNAGTLRYNKNNSGWEDYTKGTQITLENAGDYVRFRGKDTTFNGSKHVSIGGTVACSGNVMSLRLDDNGKDQGLSNRCFYYMFRDCTGLTAAPKLPETTLVERCYERMFYGCANLTVAPELPATTLAKYCYNYMFAASGLTTAPALPATALAEYCYSYMFRGCTNLTTAPALPATVLAEYCYSYMFDRCTNLQEAPALLPATTLADHCCYNMFNGCERLTTAPELPATTLADYCYYYMFSGCTRLTTAPELPATTLAPNCYNSMFYDCTSLTTAPALPATTLAEYCYATMFYGCKNLQELPALPATTLVEWCYGNMFLGCPKIRVSDEAGTFDGIKYSVEYRIPSTGTGTTVDWALYNMFGNTGGKFKETPDINTTYYLPAPTYTVTWLNDDGTTIDTTSVYEGDAPTHADPTKAEDEKYTYTFAGWNDGETTYGLSDTLPAVSGDVTYTATFDATFKGILSGDLRKGLVIDAGTPIRFAMSKTADSWAILVLQVYLDDVLVKSVQTEQFQPTEPDRYYTTTKKCIVDSYSGSGSYPRAYHTLRLKSLYTVTWKNEDGTTLETDVDVVAGKTPTYNGTTPEKAEDENYTYTFAGWSPEITAVTGDITYTATYTAKPKKLISGQSITLDGNIGINFYLDPAAAGLTVDQVTEDNLSYTFAWADDVVSAKGDVAEQSGSTFVKDGDLIKVTCKVCAAEMTCRVNASFTLKGTTESKESITYSVRDYADTILKDATQPQELQELIKAMLNYGAMAQTKFQVNTGKLANDGVDFAKGDVTDTMLDDAIKAANGTDKADNLNDVAAQHGAKWYSTSLIYLDNNTIRHYFVKATDAFKPSDYPASKADYYYYVQVPDIPAAELDNLQTFTLLNNDSFKYSALDFVKGMIKNSADGDSKNLAKALYWYNQAANKYFPAPAPAEKILVLDDVTEDTVVENGYTVTGTLQDDYKISIADGATVTLKDVNITCLSNDKATVNFAGITPLGDATILLEGANTVKGGYENYPGVFVPVGKTLTIDGTGSLNASSNGYGCGIGGGCEIQAGNIVINGGNIVINGGTIIATGGKYAAGFGSGGNCSCGNITITGGTITANGGAQAAGIGSGYDDATCGNILITGGTVTATGGDYAAGIGSGLKGNCGNITIADTVTQVTATKGSPLSNSIGKGFGGTCGTKTIAPGANVTQN